MPALSPTYTFAAPITTDRIIPNTIARHVSSGMAEPTLDGVVELVATPLETKIGDTSLFELFMRDLQEGNFIHSTPTKSVRLDYVTY
jgi:hypothetical protein